MEVAATRPAGTPCEWQSLGTAVARRVTTRRAGTLRLHPCVRAQYLAGLRGGGFQCLVVMTSSPPDYRCRLPEPAPSGACSRPAGCGLSCLGRSSRCQPRLRGCGRLLRSGFARTEHELDRARPRRQHSRILQGRPKEPNRIQEHNRRRSVVQ